jgi:hypothetical protein
MEPIFYDGFEITNRQRISTDAKILISLKYLAYGCSVNAFRDYFQLGESTAMVCVKKFIKSISNSEFCAKYFSFFTSVDAQKVEALHYEKHGVRGMLGSLDCSHFVWANCPIAHQGQYQGKEGKPTIVVEALADHNLYAWHAVFGYAGTLNDISIWDSSFLLQSLCDGSFSDLDFPFTIGGESFDQLWMLVDGIYPSLARFVKPLTVPIGDCEALFSMWQESNRKDIERFFGVFKKKFYFFSKPIPFPYMEDIIDAFYCAIILHNMAVRERVEIANGTIENHTMYDCVNDDAGEEERYQGRIEHLALQFVQNEENSVRQRAYEVQYLDALGIHVLDCTLERDANRISVIPMLQRMAQYRWSHLYSINHHKRLTNAIARELKDQYDRYKRTHHN